MKPPLHAYQRIVALGGGHGLGRLLSALQGVGSRLTGIVTTSDNGGSSGRLRQSQGCIAWGDLRNCINQLVTEPSTGSRLFEYRFSGDGELAGHNLGNLMLLALDNMTIRPLAAIELIRQMLGVQAQILPMSEQPTDLLGLSPCGTAIFGETSIDAWPALPSRLWLEPAVTATPEAVEALLAADLILLGPGSFLTSLLPPLLVPELAHAIRISEARFVFLANLQPELGPVGQLSLAEQLAWIYRLTGRAIDSVIAPADAPSLDTPCYRNDLAEQGCYWRHDRDKLLQALEHLMTETENVTGDRPREALVTQFR